MFKKSKMMLVAAALFLGAASQANADQLTDDYGITLEVQPSCSFSVPYDFVMDLTGIQGSVGIPGWMLTGAKQSHHARVVCNLDLPYIIEVNSGPGGLVVLTDGSTGKSIDAYMLQGDEIHIWGQASNGNQISDVGTGLPQDIPFWVDGRWGYTVPVGTYTTVKTATLTF